MKKRTLLAFFAAMVFLILDSRCAARSAREAMTLCAQTLIPTLFPLFVLAGMVVPGLASIRIPGLAKLLGFPEGGEGFFLLGCLGGYPLGAACITQAMEERHLSKQDAQRMAGLCSLCGPGFLFGAVAGILSLREASVIFLLQLESAILTAAFWPSPSEEKCRISARPVSLPAAINRAVSSICSVCAWVTLAAVAAGFLRRWIFPFLPGMAGIVLTGLLELTNGLFSIRELSTELRFLLCALFLSFGGVSVLLQIAGFLSPAGISMMPCIIQKLTHGVLTTALAIGTLHFGAITFAVVPAALFLKKAVEIPGRMVYNVARKEGI